MARLRLRGRRDPGPKAPPGLDPELWFIFRGQDGAPDGDLLQTASQLQHRLRSQPPPVGDPAFQGQLRARLLLEARQRRERRRHFGMPLRATLGVAALAMVAVVVTSVVTSPNRTGQVRVQATVAGRHLVPVTQAIRLSFNQPMDEAAVLQGLRINPAVSYLVSWPDPKTLVISPAHGLAPNVGYVVTISRSAARAQNGSQAPTKIVIPFGTGSAPSTPQGQIPTLVSVTTAAVAQGTTSIQYTPDGSLLVTTSGTLQALPGSSIPSPQTPAASPTPTPGSTTQSLYLLSPSPRLVAAAARGAVSSPNSQQLAYWAPQSNGILALDVVATNGSGSPQMLATSADTDPGLAWLDDGDLLYAAAGQLREVSLDGQVSIVDPTVQLDPSGFFVLSPSAQSLFARPGEVPTIYALPSGAPTPLADLVGLPTWSASGSELAYVAVADGSQTINASSDSGAHSVVLLTVAPGVQLNGLSLDPTGAYLAYTATPTGQGSELDALDVQSKVAGAVGSLSAVSDPVWAPSGDQLSALAGGAGTGSQNVDTLLLSGTAPSPSGTNPAANSALTAATSLAQLQVTAGPAAVAGITPLLAPGTVLAPSVLLPGRFDRFYAVSTTPTSAGASIYTVDLRLVRDATSTSEPAYVQETVTVQTSGASPLITDISAGPLTAVPTGPLVISVSTTSTSTGATVFVIQFDSDLNPLTVGAQSLHISVAGQLASGLQFNYSPLTRTATITANSLPPGAVTLTVTAPLADVNNIPIQSSYQAVLQPVSASPS